MANWIHDIEIKNFKSIRQAKIEDCRRINVFIGYPNVGKSNILEALTTIQIAKSVKQTDLHDFLRFEDAGELFFEANVHEDAIISYNDSKSIFIRFQNNQTVEFLVSNYRTGAKTIGLIIGLTDTGAISDLLDVYKYQFSSSIKITDGSTYKHLQSPFGDNLYLILREDVELRKSFNEILKRYDLRLLIDKTSNSLRLIRSLDSDSIFQLPYSLLADTLQRLFFYQTAVKSNRDAILLFEEPEAHMFPPYISKFTSDIWYNKGNQYFMATHSPFVLNDFLENAREELAIYVLDYQNGETIVKRLTEEQVHEAYQYGLDLFLNVQSLVE